MTSGSTLSARGRDQVEVRAERDRTPAAPGRAGWPGRARLSRVRVYLGSDHAGFELKSALAAAVAAAGHDVVDCGPPSYQPGDDYPPYVMRAAAGAAASPGSSAIVVGGSGNGEQIAANKIDGIRAALAWNHDTATLARAHNNANVVGIGARQHTPDEATALVTAFLETPFSEEPRHQRRIDQVTHYERKHGI